MTSKEPAFLVLGRVLRPHGVRGELRMSILSDHPERLPELETVYLGQGADDPAPRAYRLESVRFHMGYALLQLEGVVDRNEAELLRAKIVLVDVRDVVPLEDDEYYLYQLIGMRVQSRSGELVGIIREVFETGANDVYVLDHPEHGEILFPAHDQTVVEMDFATGVITVDVPDGLIPS